MQKIEIKTKKQYTEVARSILHGCLDSFWQSLKESDLHLVTDTYEYSIIRSIIDLADDTSHLLGIDIPIKVDLAPPPAKNYCFYYQDLDGTWLAFSCPKLIAGETKEKRHIKSITKAFRWAINPQRNAFFNEAIHSPENAYFRSLWQADPLSVHADHKYPAFDAILDGFLVETGTNLADVALTHLYSSGSGFKVLADSAFETRWQTYHKERVTWQLLTASDNCRKGNRAA